MSVMLYNFCPLSNEVKLSIFSLSIRYSYLVVHNVTSLYTRLYRLASQAQMVKRNKRWTRDLTVAGLKPARRWASFLRPRKICPKLLSGSGFEPITFECPMSPRGLLTNLDQSLLEQVRVFIHRTCVQNFIKIRQYLDERKSGKKKFGRNHNSSIIIIHHPRRF